MHSHPDRIGRVATSGPAPEAVIFDWGGTLTPWHTIDHITLWQEVCRPHFPADHEQRASAAHAAETAAWQLVQAERRSSTILSVLKVAGIDPTDALFATYLAQWAPHTFTDPAAAATL